MDKQLLEETQKTAAKLLSERYVPPHRRDEEDEEDEVFTGEVYKDKSQLPGGRLKRNIFDIRKHATGASRKLQPIFVIGYQLSNSKVFYEIWYLPFEGKFVLIDNFGKRIGDRRMYEDISDAVDDLVDIISKHDRDFDREDERDFEKEAEKEVRYGRFENKDANEDKALVETILERTVASRRILADLINTDIEEYKETRMKKHKISRWWAPIIGRDIDFPTKYISSRLSPFKIVGKKKEALFVIGYTLNNKIDVEIWFVKSLISGKGSFYVFDLSSGKLIGEDIKNMRQAYAQIAKKITVK